MDWFLLACCPKCQGDLVLDEGDWRCMQCGTYYYPTRRRANGRRPGRPPTPDSRPALPPAPSADSPALPSASSADRPALPPAPSADRPALPPALFVIPAKAGIHTPPYRPAETHQGF